MPFFNTIRWVVWKDLISEWRTRETMSSMLFFALIVILVFSFSFSMDQDAARQLIAGIIWVAFTFTGIIGLGKSFTSELQNDCLESLQMCPAPKGAIYLGKVAANFLFMLSVEILLFPLFVLFFNLDVIEAVGTLLIIFFLATLGLSAVGTLFSALTVQIRAREVMLPVLLLPLAVPVMIAAVEATRGALSGDPFSFYSQWIQLLIIFDIIFTVVSFWLFEFILDS
ncbi:MAG TPA: heme exporter protein CcmB [Nitrospirales bacterium]|nr:heme exporter protein CcmB [Nitrospira sp. MA-1]HNP59776.1 heme exporter protein CcmB [Nitrospirales bacterium]